MEKIYEALNYTDNLAPLDLNKNEISEKDYKWDDNNKILEKLYKEIGGEKNTADVTSVGKTSSSIFKKLYLKILAAAAVVLILLGTSLGRNITSVMADALDSILSGISQTLGLNYKGENLGGELKRVIEKDGLKVEFKEIIVQRDNFFISYDISYSEDMDNKYLDMRPLVEGTKSYSGGTVKKTLIDKKSNKYNIVENYSFDSELKGKDLILTISGLLGEDGKELISIGENLKLKLKESGNNTYSRIIKVNKEIIVDGEKIILDEIYLTPVQARFYLSSASSSLAEKVKGTDGLQFGFIISDGVKSIKIVPTSESFNIGNFESSFKWTMDYINSPMKNGTYNNYSNSMNNSYINIMDSKEITITPYEIQSSRVERMYPPFKIKVK